MTKNKELITKAKNGRNRVKAEFVPTKFEMLVRTKKIPDSKPFTVQWISLAEEKPAAGQEVLACYQIDGEPIIERVTFYEVYDTAITNDIPVTPEEIEKELKRRPDIVEQLEIVEEAGVPEKDIKRLMITLFMEKTIQEEGFYQYILNPETGRLHWDIVRDEFEFWMPLPKTPYEK